MTGAVLSPTLQKSPSRAAINPWVVAAVVVVPTFMEVLDTTIAVVALRYIAGGLSATAVDGEWVITSYLAANAIILPITGWLIAHLGRRNYFLLSIAVFTLGSGLCGMATRLGQLILFRVLQGLAGGGLQPSSQGVLLDAFPVERQGMAMTLFGLAALIAPVVGPTLGGWITDNYSWRWVFLINVPVGLLALVRVPSRSATRLPHGRAQGVAEAAVQLRRHRPVAAGHRHGLLGGDAQQGPGMGLAGRPVLARADAGDALRRGPGRAGLLGTAPSELRWSISARCWSAISPPAASSSSAPSRCCTLPARSLPALLQSLFGYDALSAGLVMSPAGFFAVIAMPIVGRTLGRGTDARWVIAAGLLTMAAGNYWMSQMNLDISPGQAVWPRVVLITGLAMCFAPANVAAYLYTRSRCAGRRSAC